MCYHLVLLEMDHAPREEMVPTTLRVQITPALLKMAHVLASVRVKLTREPLVTAAGTFPILYLMNTPVSISITLILSLTLFNTYLIHSGGKLACASNTGSIGDDSW